MSFGESDHWDVRGTNSFPTKSFMVGLLAAGLGLSRDKTTAICKLSEGIAFACTEEKHPEFLRDYQTIMDTVRANGKPNTNAMVSPRHYLTDAAFTVLLGIKDHNIKDDVETALSDPVWPPYLGRKSCIPSAPIYTGKLIEAGNDREAFLKLIKGRKEKNKIYPCVGENGDKYGRMGFIKDEIISLEPRVYKDRKVYYYTLKAQENN